MKTYINLPVNNIEKTKKFRTELGFVFNQQYSDDKALCMIVAENQTYVMFIQKDFFLSFTNRSIADSTTTQMIVALEVETKKQVSDMVARACICGGSRYRDIADHGWMYYDSFSDIDGHQREVMYIDETKTPDSI